MATSKRAYTNGDLSGLLLPACPTPCEPLQTHASAMTLQHQQVALVQSPVGSLLLSSGSWCMQDSVCTLQDWSLCFPQSCGSPIIKSHWPSRSDSLGIPSPFVRAPGWVLEPSQQWENLFGIIVLWIAGHPPGRYGI